MSRVADVAALRAAYARWAEGDFAASVPPYDENVTLVVDREIPDGGEYEGIAGVRSYMQDFLEPWESLTIAAESFTEAGDKVLVRVAQKGLGQGSGVPVENRYCQVWTFRDGRVIRLEVIMDEQRALEAAGLD